jgi:hypothetical protein
MEVLVATLLMMTLTATMLASYRYHLFALKRQEVQIDVQETARSLMDLMAREIRQAGYDPTCVKFAGIGDARPELLQVQFDREPFPGGDGLISAAESVTYTYDTDSKEIRRVTGTGPVALVAGVPSNALTFTYFDGAGAVITPAGSPAALTAAQRAAVRRVHLALRLERPAVDPLDHTPVVANLVTNVDLRNRFINSGVGCP